MHTAARAGRSPQIILLNTYRRCSHIGATACLEMQPLSNPASKVNTDHLGDCPNRCMKNITALLSQACRFRRYTLMWQASKQATRLHIQVSYHLVKFIPPRLMGLDLPRRGVIFASISGSSAPFMPEYAVFIAGQSHYPIVSCVQAISIYPLLPLVREMRLIKPLY